jgi:hypothetical protein
MKIPKITVPDVRVRSNDGHTSHPNDEEKILMAWAVGEEAMIEEIKRILLEKDKTVYVDGHNVQEEESKPPPKIESTRWPAPFYYEKVEDYIRCQAKGTLSHESNIDDGTFCYDVSHKAIGIIWRAARRRMR